MMKIKLWLFSMLLCTSSFAQTTVSDDTSSIDKIIHALYDVISGPAGPRDWSRFKNLFDPNARMGMVTMGKEGNPYSEKYRFFTPADYIEKNDSIFLQLGFYEKEIHRAENVFGNIAQVFTTYESSYSDKKFRGINAVELIYVRNRWWITSVLWQAETKDLRIPSPYLPK